MNPTTSTSDSTSAGSTSDGTTSDDVISASRGAADRERAAATGGARRGWGAVAGVVAAGAAIATGELFSGFTNRVPSLLVAIFDVLVDHSPSGVVAWSRETFGTDQKTVTIVGITVVTLALGAVFGAMARSRRRVAIGAFVGFGLVGGWAGARSPLASPGLAWLSALAAMTVGVAVLVALVRAVPGARPDTLGTGPALFATADRRRFLGMAGFGAAWALIGTGLGRNLRQGNTVDAARDAVAADLGGADPAAAVLAAVGEADTFDDIDGIASLITANDDFYRIDTAFSAPQIDPAGWTLTIAGMVDAELTFTLDELLAMDQIEEIVTLSCVSNEVGGGLVGNAVWTGVPLATLLDMAGVQADATQVVGRSVDDWTGGFPIEVAYDGRPAMVAFTMNGEPLPIEHGFPARLVVPGLYGYVSATKWLRSIELTTWEGFDGYWIPRGWSKEGPIKTQSRIDVPASGATIAAGTTPIAGVAWAGDRSVDTVEVSVDGGEWMAATLSTELSEVSWRQWVVSWEATPGDHVIEVRATDGDGVTQTPERAAPAPDGATGHHAISVQVRG